MAGSNSVGHELGKLPLTPLWAVHSLSTRTTAKIESTNGNGRVSHQVTGEIRTQALRGAFPQPAMKGRDEARNWKSLSMHTMSTGTGNPRIRDVSFGAEISPADEGSRGEEIVGDNC
jgi:hypothetical protein